MRKPYKMPVDRAYQENGEWVFEIDSFKLDRIKAEAYLKRMGFKDIQVGEYLAKLMAEEKK